MLSAPGGALRRMLPQEPGDSCAPGPTRSGSAGPGSGSAALHAAALPSSLPGAARACREQGCAVATSVQRTDSAKAGCICTKRHGRHTCAYAPFKWPTFLPQSSSYNTIALPRHHADSSLTSARLPPYPAPTPGERRPGGPRHDADRGDFTTIPPEPSLGELLCDTPPHLPPNRCRQPVRVAPCPCTCMHRALAGRRDAPVTGRKA